ncbi:hypothetical protein [Kitasatospora camelliae]|uniref:Helix-turn-helix DNA binding domain protein n=1 Tax=Kitasatospora camelliae TaxID=3156397 RepID=A0AAU8JQX4_9ACTN
MDRDAFPGDEFPDGFPDGFPDDDGGEGAGEGPFEGGPEGEPAEEELPELCDQCGSLIDPGEELFALVPDSSALHAWDPDFDGKRVLTACSIDHLAELVDQYRRRPFVVEEQWAGKVCRALEQHGEPLNIDALAHASGLSADQVDRAVDWHNERARRWRKRFG